MKTMKYFYKLENFVWIYFILFEYEHFKLDVEFCRAPCSLVASHQAGAIFFNIMIKPMTLQS